MRLSDTEQLWQSKELKPGILSPRASVLITGPSCLSSSYRTGPPLTHSTASAPCGLEQPKLHHALLTRLAISG